MSIYTNILDSAKSEALKSYLVECENWNLEDVADLTFTMWNTFEVCGCQYLVYTEDEANEAAEEAVLDSLWAFNPEFIVAHTEFGESCEGWEEEAFIETLKQMQGTLYENANTIIKALIKDMDDFVQDAIWADGRSHFLASYDGEEIELDNGFYAYRID